MSTNEVDISDLNRRVMVLEIAFATSVATISTKLDELIRTMEPRTNDVETRMRVLEKTRWVIVGTALAFGTSGGAIAAWFQQLH